MLFTILGLRFREVPYINSLTLLTPLHLYYLIFSSTNKLFSPLFVDVAKRTVSEPLKSVSLFIVYTFFDCQFRLCYNNICYVLSQELGLSPSVPVHVVLQDWIRHSDGKLSFLGFVRLLHGVSSRAFQKA